LLALLPDSPSRDGRASSSSVTASRSTRSPFLIALALAVTRDGPSWRARPSWLFIAGSCLSVAINVYATIAITRFDYWQ
jgi:hypothetical protein